MTQEKIVFHDFNIRKRKLESLPKKYNNENVHEVKGTELR
jgi:hypothetical protein